MKAYKDILAKYVDDVRNGRITAGIYTKKSVERFYHDLNRVKRSDFPYEYSQEKADLMLSFAEELKPSDLGGKTIELLPWQIYVLSNLEGWVWKDDPERKRYRMAYVEVNRKNGKTTGLLEPLILFNFLKYEASESYIVSSRDDLAEKTFKEIKEIITAEPSLSVLDCKSLAVTFPERKSRLGFFCDGGKDADGFKPRFCCLDEYHAFASDKMLMSMQYGMRSKKDAQMVIVTTADVEVSSPCYEQNLKAKRILNGTQTQDDFFSVIYALDENDDYHNPENWKKANPSLGAIIEPSVIQADIDDAELTPHKIPELKAKTFGIWGGGGEHSWLPVEVWQKNATVKTNWDEFKGMECTGGLDLAQVDDLCAFSLMFNKDDKKFFKHRFYIPEQTLHDRYRKENVNFFSWVEQGIITAIPGATIDWDYIIRDILEDCSTYKVRGIGFDRWQSRDVIGGIEEERLDVMLIEVEQSLKKLSPIFKAYEKDIKDGRVVDNNPVMLWMINNVEVKPDANGNYKPMKKSKASTQHIDGVVSSTMAHSLADNPDIAGGMVEMSFESLKNLL
ncbi:terminase TerL endonuclease subunit [Treponema sp.]|uniref:terminase large subunit n=1 Tax=Treponema sp. TaxID=166 RepID=UPI0026005D0B|nr:terminase TerL endonuclease subunit [Treponema sp.]MCR5219212.1 hypothetical protein [Treponema sp.]